LLRVSGALALLVVAYSLWTPGLRVRDGRHDPGTNGIWLQHGWLGDDAWFERNQRDRSRFRDNARIRELADLLTRHRVKHVFPHLCPCDAGGRIPAVDAVQTERFLDGLDGVAVIPWIGGVLDLHCQIDAPEWRAAFVTSSVALLSAHPRLAGVQLNIEPLPDGHAGYLLLLEELRRALPTDKILSVAAYPPPTRWHPHPDVHWSESYFRAVAKRTDLLAVMLYDTSIRVPKIYEHVMAAWTREALDWSGGTPVLLGVPTYDDAGTGYHDPRVENLGHALAGIHAGLSSSAPVPAHCRGVSLYCEWETDAAEWTLFDAEYGRLQR
jgi:hypothetical protein